MVVRRYHLSIKLAATVIASGYGNKKPVLFLLAAILDIRGTFFITVPIGIFRVLCSAVLEHQTQYASVIC